MQVIVMESQAYKALVGRINVIEKFIREKKEVVNQDAPMLDTQTVSAYLKVSKRTLQRYRSNGDIAYTIMGGKTFYSIAAVKQLLKDRNIRRDSESLDDLARKGVNSTSKL
jgi:hypothetical protein